MGTEYWLPKPPTEMEAVYVAKNMFYKPDGCRDLSKNNHDAWCMLIVDGPDELLGQEITWFNRMPDSAEDVPLEVAEDIVQHYNLYGLMKGDKELDIFDVNPGLLSHPDFNGGIGQVGPSDPQLAVQMANSHSNRPRVAGNAARYGQISGSNEDQQMQEWYDAQAFGNNPQQGDQYDNHGWVTDGESLHGGAPLRSPQEVASHLGDTVQLPGGSGQQSTKGMHFADGRNDEVFGVKSPGNAMPWWLKAGGALSVLGGMAFAMSKKR